MVNEKYAAQKFIKEYYNVLGELELTDVTEPLSAEDFEEILEKMGFQTAIAAETKSAEWVLGSEAYQFLKETSPTVRNICVFLMGLVGIYHVNPINFDNGNI